MDVMQFGFGDAKLRSQREIDGFYFFTEFL